MKENKMRISRVDFGKKITPDYCKSNGNLEVLFENGDSYVVINSVNDIVEIARKTGCAVAVCEDGELWIDG
jgi:hypothetical protein